MAATESATKASAGHLAALAAALAMLDRMLGIAVDRLARLIGPATLLDPWRGMHLDADDVRAVLQRAPHVDLASAELADALGTELRASPRVERVVAIAGGLDARELAVLLIVLAPDLDLRYERLYAYLQDDIGRKRPGADLVANLLCTNATERLELLHALAPDSRLMRAGVLARQGSEPAGDLARSLAVQPPWRDYLLGMGAADSRALEACSARQKAGTAPSRIACKGLVEAEVQRVVDRLLERSNDAPGAMRLLLHGPPGAGKLRLARDLAIGMQRTLSIVDVSGVESAATLPATIARADAQALLHDELIYVHGIGLLAQRDLRTGRTLVEALAGVRAPLVVAACSAVAPGAVAWPRLLKIELGMPGAVLRERMWHTALQVERMHAPAAAVQRIARRYRLDLAQISQAAADLGMHARLQDRTTLTERALSLEARAAGGDELARLAQRIRAEADFGSLVANAEVQGQLREICARVASRAQVALWTRGSVHARSTGITALFAGPSGTGKTLAAEVIANEVGFDLFRVDLSGVVSKYIGETEKNLDRVFAAATGANAVLFFDEADALFGKRSEVKDAHDRYANVEIAYLLQKMEQFEGLAILATNLKQNLDDAFTRRLTFSVSFALPEEHERLALWHALWPEHLARGADVDLGALAREHRLSGGNIRNVVLAAAHLAAAEDEHTVQRIHVLRAVRREYQKVGKQMELPAPVRREHSA